MTREIVMSSLVIKFTPGSLSKNHGQKIISAIFGTFKLVKYNLRRVELLFQYPGYNYQQHYDHIMEPVRRQTLLKNYIAKSYLHEMLFSPTKLVNNPELTRLIFDRDGKYAAVLVKSLPVNNFGDTLMHWEDQDLFKRVIEFAIEKQLHLVESWTWLHDYLDYADLKDAEHLLRRMNAVMTPSLLYQFICHWPSLLTRYMEGEIKEGMRNGILMVLNVRVMGFRYALQLDSQQEQLLKEATNLLSEQFYETPDGTIKVHRMLLLSLWVLDFRPLSSMVGYTLFLDALYRLTRWRSNRSIWGIIADSLSFCDQLGKREDCAPLILNFFEKVDHDMLSPIQIKPLIDRFLDQVPQSVKVHGIPMKMLPVEQCRIRWLRDCPLVAYKSISVYKYKEVLNIRKLLSEGDPLPWNCYYSHNGFQIWVGETVHKYLKKSLRVLRLSASSSSNTLPVLLDNPRFVLFFIASWVYLVATKKKVNLQVIFVRIKDHGTWKEFIQNLLDIFPSSSVPFNRAWILAKHTRLMEYFTPSTLFNLINSKVDRPEIS